MAAAAGTAWATLVPLEAVAAVDAAVSAVYPGFHRQVDRGNSSGSDGGGSGDGGSGWDGGGGSGGDGGGDGGGGGGGDGGGGGGD